MSTQSQQVFAEALGLSPMERAELVEELLASFEFPSRQQIDSLWAKEAEARIDAYEQSEIKATPASRVFDKIDRQQLS